MKTPVFTEEQQREELKLSPCPFCGSPAEMEVRLPLYGPMGCMIKCTMCQARLQGGQASELIETEKGIRTPVTVGSLMGNIVRAYNKWNRRTADGK